MTEGTIQSLYRPEFLHAIHDTSSVNFRSGSNPRLPPGDGSKRKPKSEQQMREREGGKGVRKREKEGREAWRDTNRCVQCVHAYQSCIVSVFDLEKIAHQRIGSHASEHEPEGTIIIIIFIIMEQT